jgi:hypothetical protein
MAYASGQDRLFLDEPSSLDLTIEEVTPDLILVVLAHEPLGD